MESTLSQEYFDRDMLSKIGIIRKNRFDFIFQDAKNSFESGKIQKAGKSINIFLEKTGNTSPEAYQYYSNFLHEIGQKNKSLLFHHMYLFIHYTFLGREKDSQKTYKQLDLLYRKGERSPFLLLHLSKEGIFLYRNIFSLIFRKSLLCNICATKSIYPFFLDSILRKEDYILKPVFLSYLSLKTGDSSYLYEALKYENIPFLIDGKIVHTQKNVLDSLIDIESDEKKKYDLLLYRANIYGWDKKPFLIYFYICLSLFEREEILKKLEIEVFQKNQDISGEYDFCISLLSVKEDFITSILNWYAENIEFISLNFIKKKYILGYIYKNFKSHIPELKSRYDDIIEFLDRHAITKDFYKHDTQDILFNYKKPKKSPRDFFPVFIMISFFMLICILCLWLKILFF